MNPLAQGILLAVAYLFCCVAAGHAGDTDASMAMTLEPDGESENRA